MQWIARLSPSQAAGVAIAWPALVIMVIGTLYVGARIYWWWKARRIGPTASGDVIVSITSWPTVIALLLGPAAAFLFLWFILRSADRAM